MNGGPNTDLLALAECCEQAAWPDRELDIAIALSQPDRFFNAGPAFPDDGDRIGTINADGSRSLPGTGTDWLVPRYTASLDAALTLVDDAQVSEVLNDAIEALGPIGWPEGRYRERLILFVCAAALRARAAE